MKQYDNDTLYGMKGKLERIKLTSRLALDGQAQFAAPTVSEAVAFVLEHSEFIREAVNAKIIENNRNKA